MSVRRLAPGDPQSIGRYRVLGVLGSGGMGRVLLAVGADGRPVAIKQVHAHLLGGMEYRARFRREVTASTRVSGAFTAPVIDFDTDSESPWLASAFVVGTPLDRAVAEHGPLPAAAVRILAAGLAAALWSIHQAGLIHRDLKPANVILAADGPRVIDFGIAQLSDNRGALTETGALLGSPAFMSPEQALSERLTPASDVFSLGSLLVAAATGQSPFAAPSLAYTLFNIAHTEPDLSGVSPELRALIAPCLHKDPAARPTVPQILDYLGQVVSGSGRPWPEPLHLEIDRLGNELAALTADPDATSVLPGARRGRFPQRRGTFVEIQPRPHRRRVPRVLLAALAVLMVVVVTAGLTWIRWGEQTSGATAQQPDTTSLAQLREADACAWLRTALGPTIPDGLVPGWPTTVSDWSLEPGLLWACYAEVGNQFLFFSPGGYLADFVRTDASVSGRPMLRQSSEDWDCTRGVRVTDEHHEWGLVVGTNMTTCAIVEHVLARVATVTTPPRMPDADLSLARVDPCALVDRDTLNSLIGPLPNDAAPKEFSAHTCEWQGRATITVNMHLGTALKLGPQDRVIDFDDGRKLIALKSTVPEICNREYDYRQTGQRREKVEIKFHGGKDNDSNCRAAESVARVLIPNLPK
ncbi:serine/threonine-protein kinase [Nocardia huaxiensis]|uniref:serine/threonine-protein kinase n=1 Tax=Nocardia huaxiensis TaxID=2755382 RepID=UPI001E4FF79A|nr:serine/threonine-protein kinase [Nocardia huaxiensis]UFS95446.1 serine/threonine protein kinase [Nocardia huaxiensis]